MMSTSFFLQSKRNCFWWKHSRIFSI